MIHHPFSTEFRLQRQDSHAVGFDSTIPATFADILIDKDPPWRIRKTSTFTATSFFCRTGLLVDQNRNSRNFPQTPLHLVQFFPVVDFNSGSKTLFSTVSLRIIGHHHHFTCSFRPNLLSDPRHGQWTVHRLTSRHRHRVIEQDFEGNIDIGSYCRADGQQTRMKICPVSDVLKNMFTLTEKRFSYPVGSLRSHVGKTCSTSVHPLGHIMASDPCISMASFRNNGRRIMGTSCTEIRQPRERFLDLFRGLDAVTKSGFTIPEFCQDILFQRCACT